MLAKLFVLVLFLTILISLASGLVFLLKDRGETRRTVKALTFRIALSLVAFAILMLSYFAGWIQPHGLIP